MNRIKAFKNLWNSLPKTVKVFVYLSVSIILSETLIELGGLEQGLLVRILAQVINLGLVLLKESVPAIKAKLMK